MTLNLHYACDTPKCHSSVTLSPDEAKDNPVSAITKRGWTAYVTAKTDDPDDGNKVVCFCPTHKPKAPADVPVPSAD